MTPKFITTEDETGKLHSINVSEIVSVDETDSKYLRLINLSTKDENGKHIVIESIHSHKELIDMINDDQPHQD